MTEHNHYERHAERHRRLAALAVNPAVRLAHEQLAASFAQRSLALPDAKDAGFDSDPIGRAHSGGAAKAATANRHTVR